MRVVGKLAGAHPSTTMNECAPSLRRSSGTWVGYHQPPIRCELRTRLILFIVSGTIEVRVLGASAKRLRPTAEEKRQIGDKHF